MTQNIQNIIKIFEGHQLYFVGGHVRDKILGIESNDIDFATNLKPEQIIHLANSNNIKVRYTSNSFKHGTIVVDEFEITTFRKDVSCDGRNCTIEFAKTIEEDLSRRDFTINSIAINAFTNEFIDPFDGIGDIRRGIIRAVGNPKERLAEDTLRALRAIRFANRFGFIIESELLHAILNTSIDNLSVERVREEFIKILETRNDLWITAILCKVLPEFKMLKGLDGGKKHNETVDKHSLMTMEYVMKVSPKPLNAFIAILHDIGKFETYSNFKRMFKGHEDVGAEKIKEIMTRMKFSNDEIDYAYIMVKNHIRWHFFDDGFTAPSDRAIRRAIRDLPDKFDKEEMISDLILLTWADCQGNLLNEKESFEDYTRRKGILARALEMIREKPEVSISSGLELNGRDLIEMGFKPSPIFNTILTDVLNKVIGEDTSMKLENDKEILKKYVKDNYKNN